MVRLFGNVEFKLRLLTGAGKLQLQSKGNIPLSLAQLLTKSYCIRPYFYTFLPTTPSKESLSKFDTVIILTFECFPNMRFFLHPLLSLAPPRCAISPKYVCNDIVGIGDHLKWAGTNKTEELSRKPKPKLHQNVPLTVGHGLL